MPNGACVRFVHRRDSRREPTRAFTLVELLVVIGIIAVLIGVLLPVLAGVQDRGRDIKCQSNLRGILQAMHGYAAENGGQFPWGLISNHMVPGSFRTAPSERKGDGVCWAALVARYWNRDVPPHVYSPDTDAEVATIRHNFPAALTCPDALQYRDHEVSYAMSMTVGASPYMDVHVGGDNPPAIGAMLRPVRQHQLTKDTAVLWDTALVVGTEFEPQTRMGADIDAQRIWQGAKTPQYRFYTIRDPFLAVAPGTFAYNNPINLNMANWRYRNRETISEQDIWPYQGNLRFRHRKNTTCNVAFADGSVRAFTAKQNPDRTVRAHDALRRYFMLKWPPGVRPDTNFPH